VSLSVFVTLRSLVSPSRVINYFRRDTSRIFRRHSRISFSETTREIYYTLRVHLDPVYKVDFVQAIMQIILYVKHSHVARRSRGRQRLIKHGSGLELKLEAVI